MYIDSRVWRPGPGGGDEPPPRDPWPKRVHWATLRWGAALVWLFGAGMVTPDPAGAGIAWLALVVATWRIFGWLGRDADALREHRQ
jgi:hypothetical protein